MQADCILYDRRQIKTNVFSRGKGGGGVSSGKYLFIEQLLH